MNLHRALAAGMRIDAYTSPAVHKNVVYAVVGTAGAESGVNKITLYSVIGGLFGASHWLNKAVTYVVIQE